MDEAQKLLKYWYKLEFFSPFWPEKNYSTVLFSKYPKRLPWLTEPDPKYHYDIYLGEVKSQDLIIDMLKSIGENDDNLDKDYSRSCICAFKVTWDGQYIENSFSVSTFVWAVAKIIKEKSLKAGLDTSEIRKFNNRLDNYLTCINQKIEYNDLKYIYKNTLDEMALGSGSISFRAHINKSKIKPGNQSTQGEKMDEAVDLDVNTDMFSSFYTTDIDMIRRNIQPGDRIVKYIEALIKPAENQIEIDTDVNQMKNWLSPQKYPLGKWPSKHSPSLMQQIAINIAISENQTPNNMFSVNGPPGTGKTALLKEIIASNVVDRALLLYGYDKPDDAFTECHFAVPDCERWKNYYQPDPKLTKYGIIVASNNNAAVENISIELPLAKDVKEGNTSLFDIDENKEIYFSEIAKATMDNDSKCWGLISARLGKKANINKFKKAIGFNEKYPNKSLGQLYEGEIPSWEQARKAFKNKHDEVIQYRGLIKETVEKSNQYNQILQEYQFAKHEMYAAENNKKHHIHLIDKKTQQKNDTQFKEKMLSENLEILNKRIPIFKKVFPCFFKKDPLILEKGQTRLELDSITIELTSINTELIDLQMQLETLDKDYINAINRYEEKEKIFLDSKREIEAYREIFGDNFADKEFWEHIAQNRKSQIACPWTNKTYDTLREELFYYALMLQKAFVLNSSNVKHNIECLCNMWNNNFSGQNKALGYSYFLNTLFLVVPVISTTFASVQTFLQYIGKNELGLLIIDEAGQATPQSSLGALWRTRKAIIVGDPLQVEPFTTVPKELSKKFAEELNIPTKYRRQELSTQELADYINPYGGCREYPDRKLWLGCPLVVHRRCINPMFSISNEIAYNSRMFMETKDPDINLPLLLKKSIWINIKGVENGNKDHTVPEQNSKVIEMVLDAFALQNDFPSLYIISPFKSIKQDIMKSLKKSLYKNCPEHVHGDIDNWVKRSCGTVHTFQGKEANEVIVVLGCDRKSGTAAANWVGDKLNILNVAVTRAKYRIAIIGDSELWRRYPNFALAYEALREDQGSDSRLSG